MARAREADQITAKTDQERTARLEGIVETWNRVLDRRVAEMVDMRRRTDAIAPWPVSGW